MKTTSTQNNCQNCGAQSTTLETYFQWTVCSECAFTLRAQPARHSKPVQEPRSAKRARCNCCNRPQPRDQLDRFTHKIDDYQAMYGKLVCTACAFAMLTPCKTCYRYRHISDITDPYAAGMCFQCRAQAERARWEQTHSRQHPQQAIIQAPKHARLLAEYAGERLEWPCSAEELKRVWKHAARRTHPDTGGSSEAFRAAKASYDVLAEVAR